MPSKPPASSACRTPSRSMVRLARLSFLSSGGLDRSRLQGQIGARTWAARVTAAYNRGLHRPGYRRGSRLDGPLYRSATDIVWREYRGARPESRDARCQWLASARLNAPRWGPTDTPSAGV